MNALIKAPAEVEKYVHLTLSPCMQCARLMLNSNVKGVVFIERYRDTVPIEFLRDHIGICHQPW